MKRTRKLLFSAPIGLMFQGVHIATLLTICFLAIIIDVITSWQLARRLKKQGKSTGKLKSEKIKNVIPTIINLFLVILLAQLTDTYVLEMVDNLYLPNWAAAIFILYTTSSILENISSCNGAAWARAMQLVLADKSHRHYDIDINNQKINGDGKDDSF